MLRDDSDKDWERFAREDPYFGVLFDSKYRRQSLTPKALEDFFASGEAHVDAVFRTITGHLDPAFVPHSALDFGCGVGRLLLPLSHRCRTIVGVDVSPSMLDEARRNCAARGAPHVQLVLADDQLSGVRGPFDLIHSYIVLQHVPRRRGERLLARLVELLADGGVGVLHLTFANELGPRARLARWARANVPFAHALLNLRRGRRVGAPLMQMNRYDLNRVFRMLQDRGCHQCHVRFTDHFGHRGVMLFFCKRPLPSFERSAT